MNDINNRQWVFTLSSSGPECPISSIGVLHTASGNRVVTLNFVNGERETIRMPIEWYPSSEPCRITQSPDGG